MGIFKGFMFGMLAGAALAVFAMSYHVVHTADGLILVSRTEKAPLRSSYVDIRKWSLAKWQQYPEVSAALAQSGRGDLMRDGIADSLLQDATAKLPQLLPTAQSIEQSVPIRFFSPAEQQTPPAAKIDPPHGAAPQVIPWDEFLKGSEQSQTNPPSREDQSAAVPAKPQAPAVDLMPYTAMKPENEVIPELYRAASGKSSVESMTETFARSLREESAKMSDLVFSELQPATPALTQPLAVDPATEAPSREWVSELLQSLIPQSSIQSAPVDQIAPAGPTALNAPQPFSVGTQSIDLMPVDAPQRAVRPF